MTFIPYLVGVAALLLAWVLYRLLAGTWNIWKLVTGTDDRAAAVAHCRRLEEILWRELELLPSQEICLLYEMAMRGG